MGSFTLRNMEAIAKILEAINLGGRAIIDSRLVKSGDIFFGLKGDVADGNLYAQQALAAGATIAVIDNPSHVAKGTLLVPNVLECLQQVALCHRKALGIPLLAITGSNGKTTTKELLSSVLTKKYAVSFTQGNLNNHIGVPLTILSFTRNTEFGVVEMGANHMLEISRLVNIAEPNFGIITNIGKAHLEGFGSVEGIMEGKGELYDFLDCHHGIAFYCADSTSLTKMVKLRPNLKTVSYSKKGIKARVVPSTAESPYLHVEIDGLGIVNSHLFGSYNFENILAAVAVGRYFQISDSQIKEAIEEYIPSNNRSQIANTANNVVLLDCYNANPSSMSAALQGVSEIEHDCKVAILGDMLELGEYSLLEHKQIVEFTLKSGFQHIFLVGSMFQKASKGLNLMNFATYNELAKHLSLHPVHNSFVLVKGSRGIQLEKIFDKL